MPPITTTLLNTTMTLNSAAAAGGLFSYVNADPAQDFNDVKTILRNSFVAGNVRANDAADNIGGVVRNDMSSHNFVGSGGNHGGLTETGANGNILGNDTPQLGPLAYNGGPTQTHSPLPNSPVINKGNPSAVPGQNGVPLTDQRGQPWDRVVAGLAGTDRIDIGAFERQANPLPGDYNFNAVVEAGDYTVWRDTLGSTTDLRADGDFNGVINVTDYQIWKGGFGNVLADPSGNGATDVADYLIWAATNGSTTDLRADCNEDGIVDDDDFQIWFDTFGSTLEIAEFGLLSNLFDPDAPPAVVGIALGLPGIQAMDFTGKVGSGEQIRSVPLIAANTLNITFSRDVVVAYTDLQIANLDGASPTIFDFDYDSLSQTATWTFTTSLTDGRYLVRLSDAIKNVDGKALDGEFLNPISLSDAASATFPSGDGDAGGEFRFRFTVLSGDTDHNNIHGSANYQNWQSTEPGLIIVSTTADDFDGNLSFGDVSLREAVNYANIAGTATAIQLPTGRYVLTRVGTEGSDTAQNDLDVLASMTILGAGAGLSIIDNSGLTAAMTRRAFDVAGSGVALTLDGLTIAHGTAASENGLAVRVGPGASLEVVDSALVHHISLGGGAAIYVDRGDLAIRRSVVTNNWNQNQGGAAVYVKALTGAASVLVEDTLFAVNHQYLYGTGNTTKNVQVVGYVTKTNNGGNLYDDATGGFFDTTPGEGDHLGSVDYIVTSVADTMNHADNSEALSIREAVDLANQAAGQQEIWLPAWRFTLTRDRGTHATDTDVSYGDLDVKDSLVIRGVTGRTSIAWKAGVADKGFDLLGDFNSDGEVDYGSVSAADYTLWQDQNGSSGEWEQFSADADDDGDVDQDDYTIWQQNFGHSLQLFDLTI